MALGKVYSFGPTFRAEKSKTRRHLTEFWMVEPEVAYAELDDVMELAEGLISFHREALSRKAPRRPADHWPRHFKLEKIEAPFPRISYDDAVKNLAGGPRQGRTRIEIRVGRRSRLARRNLPLSRNSTSRSWCIATLRK